jgi:hypothetical protein
MIEVAASRVQKEGRQDLVRPLLLRAEDISTLPADEPFDGAFSNFGALNCLDNFRQLALDLGKLLKPGATALLCWMGPHCLWEMAWYSARGNPQKAFRRLDRNGVTGRIADGAFVRVNYPSVRLLARTFAPEFRLKSVKGVGVAVPPSYLEAQAQRHLHLLRFCEQTDLFLSRCPGARALADHILLRFQRETATSGNG